MMKVRSITGRLIYFLFVFQLVACTQVEQKPLVEFYNSEFFKQVQLTSVFGDSKTFVDCTPKRAIADILADYEQEKESIDLKAFVLQNFNLPEQRSTEFVSDTTKSMRDHINTLWPILTQEPDKHNSLSSLIPLPTSYIVPGGRFREIYYWDSYFTLLGLKTSGEDEMAMNMVRNFSFLIDSIGFIPNGNRAYYASRSQPPFYSLMVSLVASENRDQFISFHESMLKEYNFWMSGSAYLSTSFRDTARVVFMPDSSVLNRYWDNFNTPRPESFKEDYELVEKNHLDPQVTYRHLRAGAESGWDYSSRWFKDKQNIATIHTTDIVPIDLNTLMYHMELMIAQSYNWQGLVNESKEFILKADRRKIAIQKYLWDEQLKFYTDFDFVASESTGVLSLAGVYPLFFQMATKSQAKEVKSRIENEFLASGGFITTLNQTGQQWDAPNGWAPLQWMTINGLYNYGYSELGNEGAERWIKRNAEVYKSTGKMMEKYNLVDSDLLAGGGEYPLQDGFGWTNGVALALSKILDDQLKVEMMRVD